MKSERIRLWDLPTRIFHWSLVLCVLAAIITGKLGGNAMVWHGRIGLVIVGLITFRLVWGLNGPTYARFAQFLPTPRRVFAYLGGRWQGIGHNPLGALSIFAMLAILAALLATGIAGNDDIAFRGPLFELAGKDSSDRLIGWHRKLTSVLILLLVLHLLAIAYYSRLKRENLVRPMLTGWKDVPAPLATPTRGGGPRAFVLALALALAAVYTASGHWLPAPPPAPAQQAPAW